MTFTDKMIDTLIHLSEKNMRLNELRDKRRTVMSLINKGLVLVEVHKRDSPVKLTKAGEYFAKGFLRMREQNGQL